MKVSEISKKYGISLHKITAFLKIHKLERDTSIKNQPYKWTDQDIEALKEFAAITPSQKHQDNYIYLFYIVQRKQNKNYKEQFIGRYPKEDRKLIEAFCESQRKLYYKVEMKWRYSGYMKKVRRDHTPEEIEAFRKAHLKKMYNIYESPHRAMMRIINVLEFVAQNMIIYQEGDAASLDNLSDKDEYGSYTVIPGKQKQHNRIVYPDIPVIYKYGVYKGPYKDNKNEWQEYITKYFFEKPPLLSLEQMQEYINSGETFDPLPKKIQ